MIKSIRHSREELEAFHSFDLSDLRQAEVSVWRAVWDTLYRQPSQTAAAEKLVSATWRNNISVSVGILRIFSSSDTSWRTFVFMCYSKDCLFGSAWKITSMHRLWKHVRFQPNSWSTMSKSERHALQTTFVLPPEATPSPQPSVQRVCFTVCDGRRCRLQQHPQHNLHTSTFTTGDKFVLSDPCTAHCSL